MAEEVLHVDMGAVARVVSQEPEWQRYCRKQADEGLGYARSIAPVRTGRYRASLFGRVGHGTVEGSAGHTAPTVEVGSDCEYAMEVEFQAPARHHVLLRTWDHLRASE